MSSCAEIRDCTLEEVRILRVVLGYPYISMHFSLIYFNIYDYSCKVANYSLSLSMNYIFIVSVQLYDVFESETFIFLVFELCRNGELFDYLTSVVTLSEKKTRQVTNFLIAIDEFILLF